MIITRSRIGIPKQRNCSPKKRFDVLYVSSEDTKNPEDSCKSPGFSEKVKISFIYFASFKSIPLLRSVMAIRRT